MQIGDKIVRITNVGWSDEKRYKVLEVDKVTATGRINLKDGTTLNEDLTERGRSNDAWSRRPNYQPLTDELAKEILLNKKRKKLKSLLETLNVNDLEEEKVSELINVLLKIKEDN